MIETDDIDDLIRSFGMFLDRAWEPVTSIHPRSAGRSLIANWLQANWEMLVEGAFDPANVVLEPYGEGADCHPRSSRVWRPDALPTHAVSCIAASRTEAVRDVRDGDALRFGLAGAQLEELVTRDGRWYARRPPFDLALILWEGEERLVSTSDVRFVVRSVTRGM